MFRKRHRFRLVFKSGRTEEIRARELSVTRKESQILKMEWVDMRPRPLFLDLDEIAAVLQLD